MGRAPRCRLPLDGRCTGADSQPAAFAVSAPDWEPSTLGPEVPVAVEQLGLDAGVLRVQAAGGEALLRERAALLGEDREQVLVAVAVGELADLLRRPPLDPRALAARR